MQPDDFRSIGASTATFAAVGIVGAFVWRRGYYRAVDWRRSVAPVFAAIAMLAFTGMAGENIDVDRARDGFCGRALCGVGAAAFDIRRIRALGQCLCGAIALAVVVFAWALAGGAV